MDTAVRIISTDNHQLTLETDVLQRIFEADELRGRSVVVISIAGSQRHGKSFLLNFFLNYLNAQVSEFIAIRNPEILISIIFHAQNICSTTNTM